MPKAPAKKDRVDAHYLCEACDQLFVTFYVLDFEPVCTRCDGNEPTSMKRITRSAALALKAAS